MATETKATLNTVSASQKGRKQGTGLQCVRNIDL